MAYTQEQKDQILQRLNNTYGADAVNNLTNQIQSGNTQQAKATANQMKQNTQQNQSIKDFYNQQESPIKNQIQENKAKINFAQNFDPSDSEQMKIASQMKAGNYQGVVDYQNNKGTQQYTTNNYQYDPNEQFDSSMIGENKGVSVKEGTAQVTGKPDYQATSDARMQEITNNLNSYYATNKEYFADRSTFNSIFDYDKRDVSQQKLLDSYRKKVENQNKTSGYTTGDSITQGMNNGEITTDMWNYIKEYNQDAYNQWQQSQQEKIDQMIANMSAPADPESTADSLQKLVDKLNIQAGDPYDLIGQRESYMESTGANNTLRELQGTVAEMKTKQKEYEAIVSKYSNTSSWGLGGAAANNARMLKALAPVTESFSMLAQTYSTQNTLYSTQMATANQAVSVMQAQAQEDQRVFNQKLSALGFAMEVNSYRTPEQQAQLQLQTQQISNEMSLLNQSKMNDLSLYNQYATAKMQNQLAFELTDLNVSDKEQAKRNLNNVLSEYYSQYGDIIQRSQSQALQDIMDYAEKNGCSVAEALTKNFIEPLQSKSEYKSLINNNYKMSSVVASTNPDGTIRYDDINVDVVSGMEDFLSKYHDGQKAGQCGKFVNDYLESLGLGRIFGNDIKQKLEVSEPYNADDLSVGDVVVFDYSDSKLVSENSRKYGHVAIVKDIDRANNEMTIVESNYGGTETVHTRTIKLDNSKLAGMYSPGGQSSTSNGDKLDSDTRAEANAIIKQIQTGSMTPSETSSAREKFKERGILDEFNKALDKGYESSLTDKQEKARTNALNRLNGNAQVKAFEEAYGQLDNLITALQDENGAGDMSAIFTFMKTLDPSSVVRESEFDSAAKTAGVLNGEAIWQNLVKHKYDGSYLTSSQREAFKKIAVQFVKNKAKTYQAKYSDYQKELKAAGISGEWADATTNMAQMFLDEIESAYPTKNDAAVVRNTYYGNYTSNKVYTGASSTAYDIFNS